MQKENFNTFFFCYGRYLQYDLIHSLEQETELGRNVDILMTFRDFFKLIITTPNLTEDEFKEGKSNLDNNIATYIGKDQQECLNLQLDKISKSAFDYRLLLEQDFKDLLSDFCGSCDDFKIIDRVKHSSNQEFNKDKKGKSVLTQALLEFNNALSHIFISVYNGNDDLKNMEKAKNHLYRGILDNYKMVIRLCIKQIKQKDSKLFDEFKEIRMQECLDLGKNIQNKKAKKYKLHIAYKEFYASAIYHLDFIK